jgi:hypothetical protein
VLEDGKYECEAISGKFLHLPGARADGLSGTLNLVFYAAEATNEGVKKKFRSFRSNARKRVLIVSYEVRPCA